MLGKKPCLGSTEIEVRGNVHFWYMILQEIMVFQKVQLD